MAAAALAPRADTRRIVEWDELPESVKAIRSDFNPLADGVLMKHQAQWVAIKASIKVCAKGRRTGITFAEALADTIDAASRRDAGGTDVFYIPDAKEKGLEFIGYCARLARTIAEAQGQGVSAVEEYLFEDQDEQGNSRGITAWRIRFASGFKIVALSSRPASIRGLQGRVVIDEAAFHADVQAVLDAATALLIWGGSIHVISSHNGKANPFNQFVKDIEAGLYGEDAKVFVATFDDAVRNGLYERAQYIRGEQATPEGKAAWYRRIRSAYGPRKSAMREELDAIPRDGGGTCLPSVWIERAMPAELPVLRLTMDDDFAREPEYERIRWCRDWIERNLAPVLADMDPTAESVAGMDYARHRHFSVILPLQVTQTLRRKAPFIIELANVPTRQQEQILWATIGGMPRFRGVAIDATGPGQTLAEYTADKFGQSRVHQVTLSRAWYGMWMPKFITAFEDGVIELPRDRSMEADLRAIESVDGIPMVPAVDARDIKDAALFRHGDGAIAGVLAWFASLNKTAGVEFEAMGIERISRSLAPDYLNLFEGRAWA